MIEDRSIALAIVGLWLVLASSSVEAQAPWTLERALVRARARAPAVLVARARIAEARGRSSNAGAFLTENPHVSVSAGPRVSDGERSLELEVEATQTIPLGGGGNDRFEAATAELAATGAEAEDAARVAMHEVATAFIEVLHARDRQTLAREAERVASATLQIVERRHGAGDVTVLDVNLARADRARAQSEVAATEATRIRALGELRVILGIPAGERVEVVGDLTDQRTMSLTTLVAGVGRHPELVALRARLHQAEAEYRAAGARAWPDIDVGARYAREGGENIYLGTLGITVPVVDRGQPQRLEASARVERVRTEINVREQALANEIRARFTAYAYLVDAADVLSRDAVPLLSENERLAQRGYEAGETPFIETLLIRSSVIATRFEHLERLREAALARVALLSLAGALQ